MPSLIDPLHLNSRELLDRVQHLKAVVVGFVREDGTLQDSNAGLRRLLARRSEAATDQVRDFFMQPRFEQLLAAVATAEGEIYRGVITVGDAGTSSVSLKGTVHRRGNLLILVAEFDVAEMEALNTAVVQLNEEMANVQRELARQQRQLEDKVKERTASLAQAMEAAEASSQVKSIFLANMSHELRTPMNTIVGMTDLAIKRASDPQQKNQLERVRHSARRLLDTINDILDIAKLETGRLKLESVNFDVGTIIEELTHGTAESAANKGLSYRIDVAPQLRVVPLCGDPYRVRQIVKILLDNAIKFTTQGSVQLQLTLEDIGSRSVILRGEVRDSGIGIAPEDQPRIFDGFQQADGSLTRKFGGVGLGLTMCNRLVKLMDGALGVSSVPGLGSTFWFTVQLTRGSTQEVPAPNVPHTATGPWTAIAGLNVEQDLHLVQGQASAYQDLLQKFASTHAQDAVQLRECLTHNNTHGAQLIAHTLKGSAGNLGALTVQQHAAALDAGIQSGATQDELLPEIGALELALEELCTSLASTLPPQPQELAAAKPDLHLLRQVLDELEPLLASGNVKANKLVHSHRALLRTALGHLADQFEQQVGQFQQTQALQTLAQARQQLDN